MTHDSADTVAVASTAETQTFEDHMLTLFANHAGGTCPVAGPADHDAEHGASTLTLESVPPSVLPHVDHWH